MGFCPPSGPSDPINMCHSNKERGGTGKLGMPQVGSMTTSEKSLLQHLTLLFLLPTTRLDVINVILLYRLLQVTERCSSVGLLKVFVHKIRHLQVLRFSGDGVAQGPETRR